MKEHQTIGARALPDLGTGNPELAKPPAVSVRRVVLWSVLGSSAAILLALAATPARLDPTERLIDDALAFYGRGDREGARAIADDLVQRNPGETRAWLLEGMLAEDRQDPVAAERAYLTAHGLLGPDDVRRVDVEVTLADLLRRKGDAAGALTALDKVARARGESGRIHHARALAFIDLRRFDEALSETRLIAEERFGGGVAKKLEKQIRSLMDAAASRGV